MSEKYKKEDTTFYPSKIHSLMIHLHGFYIAAESFRFENFGFFLCKVSQVLTAILCFVSAEKQKRQQNNSCPSKVCVQSLRAKSACKVCVQSPCASYLRTTASTESAFRCCRLCLNRIKFFDKFLLEINQRLWNFCNNIKRKKNGF